MNTTLAAARLARQNGSRTKRAKLVPQNARSRGVFLAIADGRVYMVFDADADVGADDDDAGADDDADAAVV